jgi:hypothetical protein
VRLRVDDGHLGLPQGEFLGQPQRDEEPDMSRTDDQNPLRSHASTVSATKINNGRL